MQGLTEAGNQRQHRTEPSSLATTTTSLDLLTVVPKIVRLEFPRFRGENASGWVYKAYQFFQLYNTPINQRILLDSYHMEDEALIWFQEAKKTGQFTSWEALVRALHIKFGALAYDDLMEALTKLRQVSFVSSYKAQFEALSNRIKELFEKHKLGCFLSGLRDEIRLLVKMFNQQNLNSAFGLAKIQEEYLLSNKKTTKPLIDMPKPSILGPPPPIKNEKMYSKTSKLPIQRLLAT